MELQTATTHKGNVFHASAGCLLVFVDETGHEEFADEKYPIFGMGGCIYLAGAAYQQVDLPWKTLRSNHFSELTGKALHACELKKPSQSHLNALGTFFRQGNFARFATMAKSATTRPDDIGLIYAMAPYILQQVTAIAQNFRLDSIGFIFEESQRLRGTIERAFDPYGLKNQHGPVPTFWNFLPKSAMEPGLEIADFILHAAGGQVRRRLRGKNGFGKDFTAVFQSQPGTQVRYIEIDRIEVTNASPT